MAEEEFANDRVSTCGIFCDERERIVLRRDVICVTIWQLRVLNI